jgi:hypothetical protein
MFAAGTQEKNKLTIFQPSSGSTSGASDIYLLTSAFRPFSVSEIWLIVKYD